MSTNLQMYHTVLNQLRQWLPGERITRVRNMALLLVGLQQAGGIHLSLIVRKWPGVKGKDLNLVNRLRRFLNNPRVVVRQWYEPVLRSILGAWVGQEIRLIIDCTKVGFNFRILTISLAYKKRALPLVWSVHRGRKGHVGYKQQLELFNYLAQWLPDDTQVWVMGDAGFESVHLLSWLKQQGWHFVLRQPGKNQVRWSGQSWIKLGDIPITEGETRYIGWVHLTQKHDAGYPLQKKRLRREPQRSRRGFLRTFTPRYGEDTMRVLSGSSFTGNRAKMSLGTSFLAAQVNDD